MSETTTIRTEFGNIITCNNCGASADEGRSIKHHETCIPGDGKRWEEFYKWQEFPEEVI